MSCAEVHLDNAMLKKVDDVFPIPVPRGICLCMGEDGRIGFVATVDERNENAADIKIFDMMTDMIGLKSEGKNVKDLCSGNYLRR